MSKDIRTLAIRLEPELHARLTMLAKLAAMSVADLIRSAIEDKLKDLAADPEITDRAKDLSEAIEREAAEQREALSALIKPADGAPPSPAKASRTKA
jgi:predicted DNA-binding protein